MGGWGSGSGYRWGRGGRPLVEQVQQIRVSDLHARGGEAVAHLSWTSNHAESGIIRREQSINIAWTRCHFGGQRAWMVCPRCSRWAYKLFLVWDFKCRRCSGLVHNTTRMDRTSRTDRRIEKVFRKLGGKGDWVGTWRIPAKPRYMHWDTYTPLVNLLMDLDQRRNDLFEMSAAKLLSRIRSRV